MAVAILLLLLHYYVIRLHGNGEKEKKCETNNKTHRYHNTYMIYYSGTTPSARRLVLFIILRS